MTKIMAEAIFRLLPVGMREIPLGSPPLSAAEAQTPPLSSTEPDAARAGLFRRGHFVML